MIRQNDEQITVAELARVVSDTIEKLVLPEIPRTSWASGYLHSALVVLANIEARSSSERALSIDDGAELTALLLEARGLLAGTAEAQALTAELDQALAAPRVALEAANPTDIDARNTVLSRALNSLIVWTYANKAGAAAGYAPRLLELFAGYREKAVARSVTLLAGATGRPIF